MLYYYIMRGYNKLDLSVQHNTTKITLIKVLHFADR